MEGANIQTTEHAEVIVKRALFTFVVITLLPLAIAGSQEKFTASGFGAYPISDSKSSMWLAAADHRPLVMAYFDGPNGWHNTEWKVASKFGKVNPGWAELQSKKATLRLSMNEETGEAGVQSETFKISESNTFLVLHTGDLSTQQKVIPLGVFELPASKDQPASVMLIRANPSLMQRIDREVAAATH